MMALAMKNFVLSRDPDPHLVYVPKSWRRAAVVVALLPS